MEKHIIIIVHATPKNLPGGVHGALFKSMYQSVKGPFFINKVPSTSPLKLMIKKKMMYFVLFKVLLLLF